VAERSEPRLDVGGEPSAGRRRALFVKFEFCRGRGGGALLLCSALEEGHHLGVVALERGAIPGEEWRRTLAIREGDRSLVLWPFATRARVTGSRAHER